MEPGLIPTETEKSRLMDCLPVIERIQDEKLKSQVVLVWIAFWRESGFEDLASFPNYTEQLGENETLMRHTETVSRMAEASAREFEGAYGQTVDYDILRAGVSLHDVDKLVLYEPAGTVARVSELGKREMHGLYGAQVAEKMGLPWEVVHIIASHSPLKREECPKTIAAVLVSCADAANFQSYRLKIGREYFEERS